MWARFPGLRSTGTAIAWTGGMRATERGTAGLIALVLSIAWLIAGSSRGQGLFEVAAQSTVVSSPLPSLLPNRVLIADLTGDGNADLIIGDGAQNVATLANRIDVAPGDGLGGFGMAATTFLTPPPGWTWIQDGARPERAIDLDWDGDLDLITTAEYGVQVHMNSGAGVLQSLSPIVGTWHPFFGITVDDVNGDGQAEIIVVSWSPSTGVGTLRVFSHVNAGQFGLVFDSLTAMVNQSFSAVTTADVNGDGLRDLVYIDSPYGGATLGVLLQGANLSFSYVGPFPVTVPPGCGCQAGIGWISSGDVDGDGTEEVVVHGTTNGIGVGIVRRLWIYSAVAGTLATPTILTPAGLAGNFVSVYISPKLVDLDLDGRCEFFIPQLASGSPDTFRLSGGFGLGGTMLSVPSQYLPGQFGNAEMLVANGDLDADGDRDLVFLRIAATAWVETATTALNQARHRAGCPLGWGGFLEAGVPAPGNLGFGLSWSGLLPGWPAAFGVSLAEGFNPIGSCVIGLSLSSGDLVLPNAAMGITVADATGSAILGIPIPPQAFLLGLTFYAQVIAADPSGTVVVGGGTYQLSGSRKILIW
jgi:FG-GAP-like repeat